MIYFKNSWINKGNTKKNSSAIMFLVSIFTINENKKRL